VRRSTTALAFVLLSLTLVAGGPAEAARSSKNKNAAGRQKVSRRVAAGRGSAAAKRDLARRPGAATIHKRKLEGGDRVMAAIARSPGLAAAPIADSFIRGKLFFGDPERSFRGSKAQRAILKLARRAGGHHDGTFELRDPASKKVVGYYSQISTGDTTGLHVFVDRRGGKVATTPYSY